MTLDELKLELAALDRRGVPGVDVALTTIVMAEQGWPAGLEEMSRAQKLALLATPTGNSWILERALDLTDGRREWPHQIWARPTHSNAANAEAAFASIRLVEPCST